MKLYVMETINKSRYLITEQEKIGVFAAVANRENHVILQGEMIPLSAPPSIILFERWYAKENERLAVSGKRLCRKCLKIIEFASKCLCWDTEGGRNQNAFIALPEEVRCLLPAIIKSFPALTDEDRQELEDMKQLEGTTQTIEENGEVVGYIDPESGETMHS